MSREEGRVELVEPAGWKSPKGYSNGVLAPPGAQFLFVAGQVAWDANEEIVGDDYATQFGQALKNVIAVVHAAGGWPDQIVRFTIFVEDRFAYLTATREIGVVYRELMGNHYPAMSLVEVSALLEEGAHLEIEATAAISS